MSEDTRVQSYDIYFLYVKLYQYRHRYFVLVQRKPQQLCLFFHAEELGLVNYACSTGRHTYRAKLMINNTASVDRYQERVSRGDHISITHKSYHTAQDVSTQDESIGEIINDPNST